MGLPLGPTLANIFMCALEKCWLDDCPASFRPVFYQRYIDDTFLLFNHFSHVQLFLDYLNVQHISIEFTVERESNGRLSFLDCSVNRVKERFLTSLFRKPTFSGLGSSYFSFCSFRFKLNSISSLLSRGYKISSTYLDMREEFDFVRVFFTNNGFPLGLINSKIKKFLCKVFDPQSDVVSPVHKFYFTLPYFWISIREDEI